MSDFISLEIENEEDLFSFITYLKKEKELDDKDKRDNVYYGWAYNKISDFLDSMLAGWNDGKNLNPYTRVAMLFQLGKIYE